MGASAGRPLTAVGAEKADAIVARQESAVQRAQQRLLAAVKRAASEVERSDLSPGEKQALVDEINQDQVALEKNGTLPSSDVLLPAVVDVLDEYQKMFVQLEKVRQASAADAGAKTMPTSWPRSRRSMSSSKRSRVAASISSRIRSGREVSPSTALGGEERKSLTRLLNCT